MKILHTSDWHLGRSLYNQNRQREFEQFLSFIQQTINDQKIDVLLIAGDIFHTSTPSHQAQKLYYDFLYQVSQSCCRHIVIIGGNHDSPALLNAPKDLLYILNVHVIGAMTENIADEVLNLKNQQDQTELLVCAVPYLRDKDIRKVTAGESIEDKAKKIIQGISDHYQQVATIASKQQQALAKKVPMIAMGHLFSAGGKVSSDDGVRNLYCGDLARTGANIFADCFDYVALGHLHVPQIVNKQAHIRYSGSPIAMGFGEAKQQKILCLIAFENDKMTIETLPIPKFQRLQQIKGDWQKIYQNIQALILEDESIWLEVIYQSDELMPDLKEKLNALVKDTKLNLLKIKTPVLQLKALQMSENQVALADLNHHEVFQHCLNDHEIPKEQQNDLKQLYQEIIQSIESLD